MSKKEKKPISVKQLKSVVWLGVAVLFALGILQIAQGFIDTHNYSDKIIEAIQKQTNRKVTIKGAVTISLLPVPTLFIPGLELRDPASDKPAPAATVDMIKIRVPLLSIFSENLRISSITLDRPVLELVRAEDNLIYWGWINTSLFKAITANDNASGMALSIDVHDGKILYRDSQSEKTLTFDNINSFISSGNHLNAEGSFRIAGHDMSFNMNTGSPADKSAPSFPLQLNVNSGRQNSLELKGDLNLAGDLPELKGALSLNLEDAPSWVKSIAPEEDHLLKQVTNQFTKSSDEKTLLPLKITSDWQERGLSVEMNNFALEGLNSKGAGKIKITWDDWKPIVVADIKFSEISYDHWSQLITMALTKPDTGTPEYHDLNEAPDNPIPSNVDITLNFTADQLYFGSQIWKNAQMSANIGGGAVTVNQFNVLLQGDSSLTVFGVISPSPTSDLRFEGSMETRGASLRKMLTVFDETAADLPEAGFGEFFAHANMFVSSQQLRLSEADVKLGDLHLNGGLVAYFDANPRVEAEVKLKNINFDYFRDLWREKQKKADKQEDFFLKFDKNMNFNWLKKLQTAVDFKVVVEHFTFLERTGDNASFRLYARSGDFGVYDVNFIYPNDITKGYFKINVNGEQPAVFFSLTTADLNTDYFSVEPYKSPAPAVAGKPDINQALAIPHAAPVNPISGKDEKKPATAVVPDTPLVPAGESSKEAAQPAEKLDIQPQSQTFQIAAATDEAEPPKPATGLEDLVKKHGKTEPVENKKHWSEGLLDMSWLNGFSGEFELNAGRLIHKDLVLGNLKLQATLAKDLVTFKTFSFSYWDGQCSILGSLYGGKVPGFSISFTIVDAQLQEVLHSLASRDNISGQASVSATLASSGINYLSWVSQAEGKMVLIGRNVYVQGLDMQGVVDSVAISRTSSDVLNSVNRALFNGFTIFSLDGNLNIKNGMIRTPGIGLRSVSTTGNLIGELKLVPWTMELSTLFQFPSISSETVPTMTIQYSGTPDSGEIKTDTSSLESFVAKRIISQ